MIQISSVKKLRKIYGLRIDDYSPELRMLNVLFQLAYVFFSVFIQEHHRFENNKEIVEIPNPPIFKRCQLLYIYSTIKSKFIIRRFLLLIFYQSPINLLSIYYQPSINLLSIFYQSSINLLSNCYDDDNDDDDNDDQQR